MTFKIDVLIAIIERNMSVGVVVVVVAIVIIHGVVDVWCEVGKHRELLVKRNQFDQRIDSCVCLLTIVLESAKKVANKVTSVSLHS